MIVHYSEHGFLEAYCIKPERLKNTIYVEYVHITKALADQFTFYVRKGCFCPAAKQRSTLQELPAVRGYQGKRDIGPKRSVEMSHSPSPAITEALSKCPVKTFEKVHRGERRRNIGHIKPSLNKTSGKVVATHLQR